MNLFGNKYFRFTHFPNPTNTIYFAYLSQNSSSIHCSEQIETRKLKTR